MRTLNVAIGVSERAKTWSPSVTTWEAFREKLSQPHVKQTTVQQYHAMDNNYKMEVKRNEAFIAGTSADKKRTKASITARSMLVLDADFADENIWETYLSVCGWECVMYSTISHLKSKPKYRFVIPLTRDVMPEEYVLLSSKVCKMIGEKMFDATTHQTNRLMFFPSVLADAQFIFKSCDGAWLNPDILLDIKENNLISFNISRTEIEKQINPKQKTGVIGAFNKAYTIAEAIAEFLQDVYTEGEQGRYSLIGGTSTNGLVLYDDYCYSFHGTDKAQGKMLDAFGLVAVHKFDDDKKIAVEWASKQQQVQKVLNIEEFGLSAEEPVWQTKLKRGSNGKIRAVIENFILIIENVYGKDFRLNSFTGRIEHKQTKKQWGSQEMIDVIEALSDKYDLRNDKMVEQATVKVFHKNSYHPVQELIQSLKWDGIKRLEKVFIDHLYVDDNEYHRQVPAKLMIAIVNRIFNPGCKWDYVPILIGKQGIRKSTFLKALAINDEWFSDTFDNFEGKDAYLQIQGKMLIELGELSAVRKSDNNKIKNFITSTSDYFRPPYERHMQDIPRQCVFVGSTNDSTPFTDASGNRRLWAVYCDRQILVPTKEYVRQLYAEAYERRNEPMYLDGSALKQAEHYQQLGYEEGANTHTIQEYISRLYPENWLTLTKEQRHNWLLLDYNKGTHRKTRFCYAEILEEALNNRNPRAYDKRSIRETLELAGFTLEKTPRYLGAYGSQRWFSIGEVRTLVKPTQLSREST